MLINHNHNKQTNNTALAATLDTPSASPGVARLWMKPLTLEVPELRKSGHRTTGHRLIR